MRQSNARQVLEEVLAAVPPPSTGRKKQRKRRSKRTKVTYALPADLVRQFRRACSRHGVHQRDAIEDLVRGYVARNEA